MELGTNNAAGTISSRYRSLLQKLKGTSAMLLAIGVTPRASAAEKNAEIRAAAESEGVRFLEVNVPSGARLPNDVHLTTSSYAVWTPAIVTAISDLIS